MQIAERQQFCVAEKGNWMKRRREHEVAHHTCVRLLKKGVECGNSKALNRKKHPQ